MLFLMKKCNEYSCFDLLNACLRNSLHPNRKLLSGLKSALIPLTHLIYSLSSSVRFQTAQVGGRTRQVDSQ